MKTPARANSLLINHEKQNDFSILDVRGRPMTSFVQLQSDLYIASDVKNLWLLQYLANAQD